MRKCLDLLLLVLLTAAPLLLGTAYVLNNRPLPEPVIQPDPIPTAIPWGPVGPILPTAQFTPTFTPTPTPIPIPTPTLTACQEAWTNGTRAERELGYCWLETYWVPAMVPNRIIYMHMPSLVWGYASKYAAGMMPNPGPDFVGGVSVPFCIEVGQTVWLRHAGVWDGPFKVMDCSRPVGLYTHIVEMGVVVEVDAATADRWGSLGAVVLSTHNPQFLGDKLPINIRDWFLQQNPLGK